MARGCRVFFKRVPAVGYRDAVIRTRSTQILYENGLPICCWPPVLTRYGSRSSPTSPVQGLDARPAKLADVVTRKDYRSLTAAAPHGRRSGRPAPAAATCMQLAPTDAATPQAACARPLSAAPGHRSAPDRARALRQARD